MLSLLVLEPDFEYVDVIAKSPGVMPTSTDVTA